MMIKRNERKENKKELKEGCLDGKKVRENDGMKEIEEKKSGLRVFFFLSFFLSFFSFFSPL